MPRSLIAVIAHRALRCCAKGLLGLCVVLSNAAWADETPVSAHPTIWVVHGKHNTLYLTGTIHVLPSDEPLPVNVLQAYRQVKRLLMEVDLDDLDPLATQATMLQLGWLPNSQTLQSQLDSQLYQQLQHSASQAGINVNALEPLQPWLAALTLEQAQLAKWGLNGSNGIEMQLLRLAIQDHKSIHGFETIEQQLQLFATLSAAEQREFLQQTLDELTQPDDLRQLLDAWRQGDDRTLQTLLTEGFTETPALMDSLTTQRNRNWLKQLQPLLDNDTDDYLMAVGALHLVGDQGLVALLKQAGYQVTRQ